jgi:hypothetical protein
LSEDDGSAAALNGGQEEHVFLDVRRQQNQAQDWLTRVMVTWPRRPSAP